MTKTTKSKDDSPNQVPVVIQPETGLFDLDLREIWQYWQLLYFLIWREVKVRYKQTVIGASWAILQPLITMVILTIIFGKFAKIPSDGLPYPVFSYTALLPWVFFAQALTRSGASLVSSANLVTKVYFPRLIIPIAAALAPIVDFLVSFLVLIGMMIWYGITPIWSSLLALPLFMVLTIMTALGVSLWLSPLNVRYRDVGHTLPFISQFWMYCSPVVYPVSLVPERWQLLYSLNPMVGVIEGFRWALLGKDSPNFMAMGISAIVVLALLVGGLVFFKKMEGTFADVV
jgi:lipopolysaccharide transport system permease protein